MLRHTEATRRPCRSVKGLFTDHDGWERGHQGRANISSHVAAEQRAQTNTHTCTDTHTRCLLCWFPPQSSALWRQGSIVCFVLFFPANSEKLKLLNMFCQLVQVAKKGFSYCIFTFIGQFFACANTVTEMKQSGSKHSGFTNCSDSVKLCLLFSCFILIV